MFFIFSYDLLLFMVLIALYLIMLVTFPTFTLILTGLFIWGLIAAFRGRRGEDNDDTR